MAFRLALAGIVALLEQFVDRAAHGARTHKKQTRDPDQQQKRTDRQRIIPITRPSHAHHGENRNRRYNAEHHANCRQPRAFFRLLRLLLPGKLPRIRVRRDRLTLEVFEFSELRPGS